MTAFKLPRKRTVLAIHEKQIDLFGGPPGIRDEGGIDAALARPQSLVDYSEVNVDIFTIAASVAYSITKIRHPFVDGNKRVGAELCHLILLANGYEITAEPDYFRDVILAIASGEMAEGAFVEWCRGNVVER